MAAKGYVVLFPNPRGSSNYGQEFGNIIQYHYPGDDYKDLMAGVDMMVKRGYVDQKRMGVTGGSGGGLLTNWTITQTTSLCRGGVDAVDRRLVRLLVHGRLHAVHAVVVPQGAVGGPGGLTRRGRRSRTSRTSRRRRCSSTATTTCARRRRTAAR